MNSNKTNICLNMIVKNETKVLPRLIKSVYPYIDYYVIVDTGSTDGTPELIKAEMDKYKIPGEIHHHEWVNFGHNRQDALERAVKANKADWLLFIDADEELGVSDPEFYKHFEPGMSYKIEKHHGSMRYAVPHIINISHHKWEWKGVVHNYLEPLTGGQNTTLKNPWIIYHSGEGAKSQGVSPEEKYLRDAKMLEAELEKNPNDSRSQFYLAQSYKDAGFPHLRKAYENYLKRSKMTHGWMDENYVSLVEAGRISALIGKPFPETMTLLLAAHELRPERAEALYHLARICRLNNTPHQAYLFAKASVENDMPHEGLFIIHTIYQWKRWDELAVAASQTGKYQESINACDQIFKQLNNQLKLDSTTIKRIKSNRTISVRAIKKKIIA